MWDIKHHSRLIRLLFNHTKDASVGSPAASVHHSLVPASCLNANSLLSRIGSSFITPLSRRLQCICIHYTPFSDHNTRCIQYVMLIHYLRSYFMIRWIADCGEGRSDIVQSYRENNVLRRLLLNRVICNL